MNPTPHSRKKAIPRIIPLLCAVACLLLTAMTCQKKDLPEPTQDGRDTFGCKINGKVFVAQRTSMFSGEHILVNYLHTKDDDRYSLIILGVNQKTDNRLKITYKGEGEIVPGKYPMVATEEENGFTATYSATGIFYPFGIDVSKTNEIEITKIDIENKVLSGKFSFHLIDDAGKRLAITEGRFDVELPFTSYTPQPFN